VVHVATTTATVQDGELTDQIHDELAAAGLAPGEHVVDSAYLTPARIVRAKEVHHITLLGPLAADHTRRAQAKTGFEQAAFVIDWRNEQVICPRGAVSHRWGPHQVKGHEYLLAKFSTADCRPCPDRCRCTPSKAGPRSVSFLPRPLYDIQQRNRLDQDSQEWQQRYAIRAGIEATIS